MTSPLSTFGIEDHTALTIIVIILIVNAISDVRQQIKISRLEHQLHRLIKQQKGESSLSPAVQLMAKDPKQKVAAIKLHREQNPGMTIANAKWDIENLG
jgi:ribosomal protein L7/L12